MKKKIWLLVTSMMLILGLIACGKTDKKTDEADSQQIEDVVENETEKLEQEENSSTGNPALDEMMQDYKMGAILSSIKPTHKDVENLAELMDLNKEAKINFAKLEDEEYMNSLNIEFGVDFVGDGSTPVQYFSKYDEIKDLKNIWMLDIKVGEDIDYIRLGDKLSAEGQSFENSVAFSIKEQFENGNWAGTDWVSKTVYPDQDDLWSLTPDAMINAYGDPSECLYSRVADRGDTIDYLGLIYKNRDCVLIAHFNFFNGEPDAVMTYAYGDILPYMQEFQTLTEDIKSREYVVEPTYLP